MAQVSGILPRLQGPGEGMGMQPAEVAAAWPRGFASCKQKASNADFLRCQLSQPYLLEALNVLQQQVLVSARRRARHAASVATSTRCCSFA